MNHKTLPEFLPGFTGIKIAVDNFKTDSADMYFLTHRHSDHTVGLKKKFRKPLYCSYITAQLVIEQFSLPEHIFNILQVGKPFVFTDETGMKIQVTPFDANHCSGALMFLFQSETGYTLLHTGDFRVNNTICTIPWPKLDVLFLDNTYMRSKKEFPKQEVLEAQVVEHVKTIASNKIGLMKWFTSTRKTLFIFGNYSLGKERIALECAESIGTTVYSLDGNKRRVLDICYGKQRGHLLGFDRKLSNVHMLSIRHIRMDYLKQYFTDLKLDGADFTHIVAFSCSGWKSTKKAWGVEMLKAAKTEGPISIYNLPYSEHSSYSELWEFLQIVTYDKIYMICGGELC